MKRSAVLALIGVNVIAYLWQLSAPRFAEINFALWPLQPLDGRVFFHSWQLVTYAFLHSTGNYGHLLFNMLGLYMFGWPIETTLGWPRLLAIYFAAVVSAAVTQLFIPPLLGAVPGPTLGASGGVFGLLFAFAFLFPKMKVVPLIPPIPMPAWLFATLYAGAELLFGVTGLMPDVAHFAHLGGIVGAFLVLYSWRMSRSRR